MTCDLKWWHSKFQLYQNSCYLTLVTFMLLSPLCSVDLMFIHGTFSIIEQKSSQQLKFHTNIHMSIPQDKFDGHQIIYCKKKNLKGDSSIPKVIEATGNLIMAIVKSLFFFLLSSSCNTYSRNSSKR